MNDVSYNQVIDKIDNILNAQNFKPCDFRVHLERANF